ncbi:hypothetical protein Sgly_3068 [Syntrophobotulus glycolicus DSM 8271]|uniref:Phosphodiester glycosidase domain-containing protein n=1 Tax=Syntrophobotulus glycolicus (strain DSM 8271 / FlGlyR) TaxID=645991 RepID=F0T0G4_SYNGF|nr:phosphodiester glycosidase family protein [Syntrophobotulus glycolicus]ADY57336.1 hypothetical protein Sgly_3068 [Syntrophobotulus glycolicus DSM 8271]
MKIAKELLFFSLFQLLFCSLLGFVLIIYGPFANIRSTFITTAMTTMHNQHLATIFFKQEQVDQILKDTQFIVSEKENTSDVSATNTGNSITVTEVGGKFKGYLMTIDNPARVKVGSGEIGKNGLILSQLVKKYNAVGGVNAGGFSDFAGAGTGGIPDGICIENYQITYIEDYLAKPSPSTGKYPKMRVIGFNSDNILVIGTFDLNEIKAEGLRDAVSFGPPLIVNGKPMITRGDGGAGIQPRTAIGQKKDGTVLLLVIDGRQLTTLGASYRDLQDILLEHGAYNAANLDGGSSTTMYYNGSVINQPWDMFGERALASAFIVE